MVLTPLDVSFVSMMKTAISPPRLGRAARAAGQPVAWPEPTFVYPPNEGKGDSREETGARQAEGLDAAADRPRDRGPDRRRLQVRRTARWPGSGRHRRRRHPGDGRESAVRRAHRGRRRPAGPLRDAGRPRDSARGPEAGG